MAIWNILWRIGIFYNYFVHFVFSRYIFQGFCIMYQEKSGNPAESKTVHTHLLGCELTYIVLHSLVDIQITDCQNVDIQLVHRHQSFVRRVGWLFNLF
jgi:hypothetical protein